MMFRAELACTYGGQSWGRARRPGPTAGCSSEGLDLLSTLSVPFRIPDPTKDTSA